MWSEVIMVSRRQSILCPRCRSLISLDESRCPHCGLRRPGSLWNRFLGRRPRDDDQFVRTVIYANIAMYVFSLILNPTAINLSLNPLSLLSPSNASLLLLGGTGKIPIDAYHRWWTLVSANYLHGGILHLLFNLFAFRQVAPLVVQEYGSYRMFSIYTIGGTAGFVVSYLAGVGFTIGASAAICSLIGAAMYYGRSRGGYYGQTIYRQLGGWAIAILVFGLIMPGINNWAHGGGFLAGIAIAYLLGYAEKRRETGSHRLLGVACIVLSAAVLGWAVVTSMIVRFMT
jgi:rhomboid protease GluP